MGLLDPLLATVPILGDASAYEARQVIRQVAESLGFSSQAVSELTLVASELCTNVARHAGRGELRLRRVEHPERGVGLELASWDEAPPIADFSRMLQDGWSRGAPIDPMQQLHRQGIGAGLGAVQRLSDEVHHEALPHGKEIRAVRYVHRRRR